MSSTASIHLRNVMIMSLGFLFNQFSFFSGGLIEEAAIHKISKTRDINPHAGYISLALIYAAFAIGNLFSAPVVNIIGPRWAMASGAFCYAIYMGGFLFLNEIFLYISSLLLGIGATWLWVGQGKYLSVNSDKESAGKHSAVFFTIYQSNLTFGGIFLFIMYKLLNNPEEMDMWTIKLLYGVFTGVALMAFIVFLCLPNAPHQNDHEHAADGHELSNFDIFKLMIKLFFTKKCLLFTVGSAHSGILLSFWSGIFPTAIAFTQQLDGGMEKTTIVALSVLATGLGQLIGGILLTTLNLTLRKCPRELIVTISTVLQLIAYVIVFLTYPAMASLDSTNDLGVFPPCVLLTLVASFMLGVSDGWLKSPIYSYVITVFPDESIEAFAILQFGQAVLACAAFVYGTFLTLYGHLIILAIGAISSCLCFILAESTYRKETGKFVVYAMNQKLDAKKVEF